MYASLAFLASLQEHVESNVLNKGWQPPAISLFHLTTHVLTLKGVQSSSPPHALTSANVLTLARAFHGYA